VTIFLHFSDFHILPEKGMVRVEGDPCAKVETLIRIAREMDLKPAFSIVTGDLSQNGSEGGYRLARQYVAEIEALGGPVFVAVGNVDRRASFKRIMLGEREPDDGPCCYTRKVGCFGVVVLDSQVPGSENQVADRAERCVVALHHPPMSGAFDPDHASRFREIVARAGVLAVLSGHVHRCGVTVDRRVHHVTGCAALSEVVETRRSQRVYDSSGFVVLTWDKGMLTVRPVVYSEGRRLVRETLHT
jgi:3',5'-cyclic-AMP phosphodiesterase